MLSTKGGKQSEDDQTITLTPYYLEVPIMLSLKAALSNDMALRVNAGPYLAYGLGGKGKMSSKEMGSVEVGIDLFGEELGFKRFDAGIGFGGGLEIKQFYLGVTYDLGLANIMPSNDDDILDYGDYKITMKNKTLSISLGYNF
jgi:hypothetical protein